MINVNGVDINVNPKQLGKNTRMTFEKIHEVIDMPNLIEVQKTSFDWLKTVGLREIIRDMQPIRDFNKNLELTFLSYYIEETPTPDMSKCRQNEDREKFRREYIENYWNDPKHSIEKSKEYDTTYSAPLRVKVRLHNNEKDMSVTSEIFMGDFPLMTDSGTFIVNGAERVVVSQLVRSPGAYYKSSKDKTGKDIFASTIIPDRGAWIEYQMDTNNCVFVRIDKEKKIYLTTFIRALGIGTDEEILELFGEDSLLQTMIDGKDPTKNTPQALVDVYTKLKPGEPAIAEKAAELIHDLFFDPHRYVLGRFGRYKYNKKLGIANRITGRVIAADIVSPLTGDVLAYKDDTITREKAVEIEQAGVMEAWVKTEVKDYVKNENGTTQVVFYEREVKVIGNGMVDVTAYLPFDLEDAGINEKVSFKALQKLIGILGTEDKDAWIDFLKTKKTETQFIDGEEKTIEIDYKNELMPNNISLDDIIASISYFINLNSGVGSVDDIDHLGNRRVKCVGELLQNQFRQGFLRMERAIRDRMNIIPTQNRKAAETVEEVVIPAENAEGEVSAEAAAEAAEEAEKKKNDITAATLINIRLLTSFIREFFGSSPLSQFMDQTNPLAELTHKRRLSALGPGGLSRDHTGTEVRDVHYTHYGRMCPIETPEGPNIGLISYLASFARINKYGFIEAPYRKIDKETGVVTSEVVYMTADVEDNYIVAQANTPLTPENKFKNSRIIVRSREKIFEVDSSKADFMDVSPKMVVSVATACIPFLQNDDANRALMGANMQRQAVPLIQTESPLVGTGMEYKAAVDSGICILAKVDGTVSDVSADKITVTDSIGVKYIHKLIKFKRSNQGTCINHHPIVDVGERVRKGQVIADGPSTSNGEISLGRNALIGFMTWEGYNYEDAVLLNERVVREDFFTSVHIEEYDIECRETKLGAEEITREIPSVNADTIKDLDENGIIRVGAEVRAGDILVGKVTPKGETDLSAEERLLRAIFGEKSREVRDNSLRVPHGEAGTVIAVNIFTRDNCDELGNGVNKLVRCYIAQKRKISVGDKMAGRHGNKGVVSRIMRQEDMPFLPDGTPLDIVLNPLGVPSRMNIGQVLEVHLGMAAKKLGLKVMVPVFDGAKDEDIKAFFKAAGMDEDGKTVLYDGRTGEPFDNRVTVGYMYYLKLHHLVDDKIHARSVGPYSLVTQQPLGGKAQFGGQRFGEMEVWALEAYGAAYTLQEILTVKSDDTEGRVKTYEAIVNGKNIPSPGLPEAFKVLIKELQSLGLDIGVYDSEYNLVDLKQKFDDDILPEPTAYLDESVDPALLDKDEFLGRGDMHVVTAEDEPEEETEELTEEELELIAEEKAKAKALEEGGAGGAGGAYEGAYDTTTDTAYEGADTADTAYDTESVSNYRGTDTESFRIAKSYDISSLDNDTADSIDTADIDIFATGTTEGTTDGDYNNSFSSDDE